MKFCLQTKQQQLQVSLNLNRSGVVLTCLFITTNTRKAQGCVHTNHLFTLYTNIFFSIDPSVKVVKYADDITTVLMPNNNEMAHMNWISELPVWCTESNLELNTGSGSWLR